MTDRITADLNRGLDMIERACEPKRYSIADLIRDAKETQAREQTPASAAAEFIRAVRTDLIANYVDSLGHPQIAHAIRKKFGAEK